MNESMCGTVRELIPDFVGGRLTRPEHEVVEQHVHDCEECGAELGLARLVLASRPAVPMGLADRILSSVAASRRSRPPRTWWGVSAAAIAALALGIGISSDRTIEVPTNVPAFAYEVAEGDIWLSDDGLLAGGPLFDDLSDDALLQLLDELSVTSTGGSA